MAREYFTFHRSFAEAAKAMDTETKTAFFEALCAYALDDEDVADGVATPFMALVKHQIDADNKRTDKRSESARKAAEARWSHTECEADANACGGNANACEEKEREDEREKEREEKERSKEKEEKEKEKVEEKEKENKKEKETPDGVSKKKAVRHRHGEFQNVLLTDEDYATLQELFPLDYEDRIEKLSRGKYQKGYKYKSDYIALLDWAERDGHYKAGDAQIARKKAKKKDDDEAARAAARDAANLKVLQEVLTPEEWESYKRGELIG